MTVLRQGEKDGTLFKIDSIWLYKHIQKLFVSRVLCVHLLSPPLPPSPSLLLLLLLFSHSSDVHMYVSLKSTTHCARILFNDVELKLMRERVHRVYKLCTCIKCSTLLCSALCVRKHIYLYLFLFWLKLSQVELLTHFILRLISKSHGMEMNHLHSFYPWCWQERQRWWKIIACIPQFLRLFFFFIICTEHHYKENMMLKFWNLCVCVWIWVPHRSLFPPSEMKVEMPNNTNDCLKNSIQFLLCIYPLPNQSNIHPCGYEQSSYGMWSFYCYHRDVTTDKKCTQNIYIYRYTGLICLIKFHAW